MYNPPVISIVPQHSNIGPVDRFESELSAKLNARFKLGTDRIQSFPILPPVASNDGQLIYWDNSTQTFQYTSQYVPVPSGVDAGTYGDATHVGQFTVNNLGYLTFAKNVSITGLLPSGGTDGQLLVGQTSSAPLWKTASGAVSSISAAGAFALANINPPGALIARIGNPGVISTRAATNPNANYPLVSNGASSDPDFQILTMAGGGTSTSTGSPYAAGGLLFVDAAGTAFANLSGPGMDAQVLISNGGGAGDPPFGWQTFSGALTTNDTGVIALNGVTQYNVIVGDASGVLASVAPGAVPYALLSTGVSSNPAFGLLTVPAGGTGITTFPIAGLIFGGTTTTGPLQSLATSSSTALPLVSGGTNTLPSWAALTVPGGGTGRTSFSPAHGVLVSEGTSAIAVVATAATGGIPLVSIGSGGSTDPAFSTASPGGGGTGLTTYNQGDILYASAANVLSALPAGTAGQVLTTEGASANPQWTTIAGGSGVGSVIQFVIGFASATYTSATSIPSGAVVTDVKLNITTPFSAGTTITIGRTGSLSLLMGLGNNFPTSQNIYDIEQLTGWGGSTLPIIASVGGSPAAGVGTVTVFYSSPNA